ncbi:MAG: hypothetical protein U0795_04825 [Pirellulales bacterium]
MWRALILGVAFLGIGWGSVPADAQVAELLKIIPDDAAGFVVVNDLAATSGQIEALAAKLSTPLPSPLMVIKAQAGLDKGVADHGSLVVVGLLVPRGGQQPPDLHTVMLVPVEDYGQVIAQLQPDDAAAKVAQVKLRGASMLAARRGAYLALARPEHRASLERMLDPKRDISQTAAPLAEWLGTQQLSLVLTPAGTQALGDAAWNGLDAIKRQGLPGQDPQMTAAGLGVYQDLVRGMQHEFAQVGVALNVDPDRGLGIEKLVMLKPESILATASADVPALTRPALSGLPGGTYMMAVEGPMLPVLMEAMMGMSMNVMRRLPAAGGESGLSEEQYREMISGSMEAMRGVKSMSMVFGVGQPNEGIYGRTVALMKVDQADKFLEAYEQSIQKMQGVTANLKVPYMARFETGHEEIDGKSVLKITTDMSQMNIPQTPGAPDMKKTMESLFGPDGKLHIYVAAADPQTVVLAYASAENLRRGLAAARSGQPELAADPQTVTTAQLLPGDSPWVGYLSPQGTLAFARNMVSKFAAPVAMMIPPFPDSPPIGMAMRLKADRLEATAVVPVDLIQAIVAYGAQVRAMAVPPPQVPPQAPPALPKEKPTDGQFESNN